MVKNTFQPVLSPDEVAELYEGLEVLEEVPEDILLFFIDDIFRFFLLRLSIVKMDLSAVINIKI